MTIWVKYDLSFIETTDQASTQVASYFTSVNGYNVLVYAPYADPSFLPDEPGEFITPGRGPYFDLSTTSYAFYTSAPQTFTFIGYRATAVDVSLTRPTDALPQLETLTRTDYTFNSQGQVIRQRDITVSAWDYVWRAQTVSVPDPNVSVSVAGPASILELDQGFQNSVYTISLDHAAAVAVTVSYRTVNSTATGGTSVQPDRDFDSSSGAVTFQPGETGKTVVIPIIGDTRPEGNETFFFELTGATSADTTRATAQLSANARVTSTISDGNEDAARPVTIRTLQLLNDLNEIVEPAIEAMKALTTLPESLAALDRLSSRLAAYAAPIEVANALREVIQNHRDRLDQIATNPDPAERELLRKYADAYFGVDIIDKVYEATFVVAVTGYAAVLTPGIELGIVALASTLGVTLAAPGLIAVGVAIVAGVAAHTIYENYFQEQIREDNFRKLIWLDEWLNALPPPSPVGPHGEFRSMSGAETINGSGSNATISYAFSASSVAIDLSGKTGNDGTATDILNNFKNAIGSFFGDQISGDANDNSLDGGAGADSMAGKLGNDIYFVDNLGDSVVENANEGNDLINAAINYTLSANVEALVMIDGAGRLAALGNGAANYLKGNSDNNAIDGGAGGDLMIGGAGDDIYVVDDIADDVVEGVNEGNDIVHASIDYTIGANIESLILDGLTINGAGNATGNAILGNDADNIIDGRGGGDYMVGGKGGDIYVVDDAADAIVENPNEGNDIVQAYIDYTIGENIESLILMGPTTHGDGNSTGNAIVGNDSDNILDGKDGADLMTGGKGNDIYFVDNAGDAIVESANEGNDIVHASIDYTLGAEIEALILDGSSNLAGAGNNNQNALIGNSANNTLDGRGGRDFLVGNGGNDTFAFKVIEADGDEIDDFTGNGAAVGDTLLFIGFGTAAQGATFTQVGGGTNDWIIHSGLDGHNETITLDRAATVDLSDYQFIV